MVCNYYNYPKATFVSTYLSVLQRTRPHSHSLTKLSLISFYAPEVNLPFERNEKVFFITRLCLFLNHSVGDQGGWFQTCVKVRTTLPSSNSLPLINVHPCKYVHMCSWKTSFEAKRVIRGSVSHWFYFLTPRECCMSSFLHQFCKIIY